MVTMLLLCFVFFSQLFESYYKAQYQLKSIYILYIKPLKRLTFLFSKLTARDSAQWLVQKFDKAADKMTEEQR